MHVNNDARQAVKVPFGRNIESGLRKDGCAGMQIELQYANNGYLIFSIEIASRIYLRTWSPYNNDRFINGMNTASQIESKYDETEVVALI